MKIISVLLFFLFFTDGVFGFETDGVKSISVMEGDSVTLSTCFKQIQKDDTIIWEFENTLIAKLSKGSQTFLTKDGRFTDRLKLNDESGSLTIKNIRTNHSGLYKVDMISMSGSSNRKFNVTVIGVFDPDAYKLKPISAKEGESVALNTDFKVQKDVLMLWKFGRASKGCVYDPVHHVPCLSDVTAIAKIDGETREVSLDAGDNEMFENRLKMDKLTGSLTITNISPKHSGFYILQISNNTETRYRRFNVTVSAVTQSHSHVVWKSIAIVLSCILAAVCLVTGIKFWRNRNCLFRKLRSFNCCRSEGEQETELSQKTVIEGERVTLDTDRDELQRDDVIEWAFEGRVIAKLSRAANKICQKIYHGADGRFRDKLELDSKTGSLTIRNTRTTDSGVYQLQRYTSGKVELNQKFSVSVIDSSQNISNVSAGSPLISSSSGDL